MKITWHVLVVYYSYSTNMQDYNQNRYRINSTIIIKCLVNPHEHHCWFSVFGEMVLVLGQVTELIRTSPKAPCGRGLQNFEKEGVVEKKI